LVGGVRAAGNARMPNLKGAARRVVQEMELGGLTPERDAEIRGLAREWGAAFPEQAKKLAASNNSRKANEEAGLGKGSSKAVRQAFADELRKMQPAETLPEVGGQAKPKGRPQDEIAEQVRSGAFRLYRADTSPPDASKPHGAYFNIEHEGFKSAHKDDIEGAQDFRAEVSPRKPLHVRGERVTDSAGIAALRGLVAPEEFNKLRTIAAMGDYSDNLRGSRKSNKAVAEFLRGKYPDVDWNRYHDPREMLEGYAGLLARDAGYDAIVQQDEDVPSMSEVVVLDQKLLSGEQIAQPEANIPPAPQPETIPPTSQPTAVSTQPPVVEPDSVKPEQPRGAGPKAALLPPGALPIDRIVKQIAGAGKAIKSAGKRYLTTPGHLPKDVFDLKIKKNAKIASHEKQIEFTTNDYNKAAKEAYGGWENISDKDRAALDSVLKGNAAVTTIPKPMREPVARMRREIDAMSREMIRTGAVEGDLALTVLSNHGTYVTRAYKVFDDPKWAEKVDPAVRNKAKALIRQEYPNDTDAQHEHLINSLLYQGKAAESPIAVLSKSKLGSKDLSITKRRKDIAPEIRALWGEYDDPRVNYARSVTKMAHLIGNHQFLTGVKAKGLGKFFFEESDPNIDPEAKAKIAADSSSAMAPLNGLHTYPEIKAAFEREYAQEALPTWLRHVMKANSLAKYSKTVLSPITHARNFVSNIPINVGLGHWKVSKLGEAFKATRPGLESMSPTTPDAWRDLHKRYVELGVIDEGVHAGELEAVIKDAFDMTPDQFTDSTIRRNVRKAGKAAKDAYQFGDSVWKVYAFLNERDRYAKTGLQGAALDKKAAKIVRDTMPTYSMIPEGVQKLRRFPLVGPFVSFASERMRNAAKTFGLIATELSDAKTRSIGAERLAGQVAKYGMYVGAAAAGRFLTGMGKDDEEDMREFVAPWNKNSTLVWTDQDSFIDLSYTDPDSVFVKPLRALMRGDNWVDSFKDAAAEWAAPFIGEELVAERLLDIARNKTKSGREVYSPQDTPADKAIRMVKHIWEAIEPGAITSAQRIQKGLTGEVERGGRSYDPAAEAIGAITGFRAQEINVAQSIGFKVREFQKGTQEANRLLTTEAMNHGTVQPEKIEEAYRRSDAARRKLFDDMHRQAMAAIRLGIPESEVRSLLDNGGLSHENAANVIAGTYEPYSPSGETLEQIASREGGGARVKAIRRLTVELSSDPEEARASVQEADKKRAVKLQKDASGQFSYKFRKNETPAEYKERRQRFIDRRAKARNVLSKLSTVQ
jgi:hypothetical protein